MAKKFIKLSKGSGGSADDRVKYVTYMDRGAELIKYPVIEGDTARDPVAKGYIEKPTKEPTESTVYTQSGWSKTDGGAPDSAALQNVTEDRTVYAAFTESARTFTVRFFDGDTLVHTEQVAYGGSSSYSITKEGYILSGWSPAPTNVTADMDCYAQWIEGVDFATAEWSKIAEISEAGKASEAFNLGQTRTETMTYSDGTTETIELEIVSFAEKDQNGNAVMTLVPKNLINKKSQFSKSGGTTVYADTSIIKPYLENTILPALPSDLQGVLKPTKVYDSMFGSDGYSNIALLDCDNICVYYEGTNYTDTVPTTLYGFDTTNAKRVRKTADGTARTWWVNIVDNTSGKCLYVSPVGKGDATTSTNSSNYILFKICV